MANGVGSLVTKGEIVAGGLWCRVQAHVNRRLILQEGYLQGPSEHILLFQPQRGLFPTYLIIPRAENISKEVCVLFFFPEGVWRRGRGGEREGGARPNGVKGEASGVNTRGRESDPLFIAEGKLTWTCGYAFDSD